MTAQKPVAKKTEARVSEWQSFSSGAQKKSNQSYNTYTATTSAEMSGWSAAA